MSSPLEIAANVMNATCVLLAGRNNVHTWWTGIVACFLFGWLFYETQLYADVTLQAFFVVTGAIGWYHWVPPGARRERPVRTTPTGLLSMGSLLALGVTLGYGWLLWSFTDAYAPLLDSGILAFSVLGQLLLMGRRVETWYCWLLVNTIAVPLYASRGLLLTAGLYAGFWVNAVISLRHWTRLARTSSTTTTAE